MITLTDVISAYSTLEGKIYPNINVWYGPHDSLNSAIQYIENICTQIGRSKVKGITVAVEENGTLVEYWNPTNANIFIKKHDTSIIDPATTTTTSTKYPSISLTNSTNQNFILTAPIVNGRDYQYLPVGGTAKDVKIMLIDDNSNDGYNYKKVAEIFGCDYYRNETNLGVAGSRNFGVFHCTTPYFVLLDAHMRFYETN